MNGAYYNEHDPFAAAWLRALISGGHIAPGDVDERDVQLVQPDDLRGYAQHHFFAGIGGWSLALRLAGWPDDRPVWTGSCPCQPFSSAGKGEGFNDPRHLWPAWFRLIRECRPPVVFGEQVASADGLAWFDSVSTDLEAEGFAVGAADLCAAGVGAPHIRQRLWYVAHTELGLQRRPLSGSREAEGGRASGQFGRAGSPSVVAYTGRSGSGPEAKYRLAEAIKVGSSGGPGGRSDDGGLANAESLNGRLPIQQRGSLQAGVEPERCGEAGGTVGDSDCEREDPIRGVSGRAHADRSRSPWAELAWLPCRDGKARPTQPGLFPLAHGVPNRVGTLRGAGNAIVPEVAAEFIRAFGEAVA